MRFANKFHKYILKKYGRNRTNTRLRQIGTSYAFSVLQTLWRHPGYMLFKMCMAYFPIAGMFLDRWPCAMF